MSAHPEGLLPQPALPHSRGHSRIRTDIQALRGLAVLLVLLYHAGLAAPASGFLGVDIFFVVSGFLITKMVRDGVLAGTFSFREFYFRRAKRLLPAAYVVLSACLLVAPWVLGPDGLRSLSAESVGALTFTANLVLWKQVDYFAPFAELKPLLHFWSLAIEEQYYLLLPAALVFTPPRYWKYGLGILLLTSLVAALAISQTRPDAAFYLLPFRLWELATGSAGALFVGARHRWAGVLRVAFWPALAVLLVVPFLHWDGTAPRMPMTLAVCAATLLVVLREHPGVHNVPVRALSYVGDFSYSLYLVHWPLFAFLRSVYVTAVSPLLARLAVLFASVVLAWLLWRCIEEPLRRMQLRRRGAFVAALLVLTLAQLAIALFLFYANSRSDAAAQLAPNHGLGRVCSGIGEYKNREACRTSPSPTMLLWGDSHAMHLAPALQADSEKSFAQATKSACPPLLGLARNDPTHNESWARTCIQFHDDVVAALPAMTSVEVVVLAGWLRVNLDTPLAEETFLNFVRQDSKLSIIEARTDLALSALRETVQAIRGSGKRVVWVASPPSARADTGRCLERQENGLFTLSAQGNCEVSLKEYQDFHANALAFYQRIEAELDVPVVRFDAVLCDDRRCAVQFDDVFLYRDTAHLSVAGSRLLGDRMHLSELLWRVAR